ncbi:tRNA (adenosine(37)-N6)-threonylcarbamoyltransferase complex ATPase subunit type 1 TsaE [Lishizhenia sp.]|uniref:tRNA (adenosine(37)-N6)-threonylcarbamoyltransferase complex ATPase subunit type 1 TsaE n=1 Tax=Lishizhenia sp. TaxID=2497594 RepID=UPI00299DFFA4|nr:tRNA (adenosine(37)-N6)-threonylcarbamoyltransferase complex ATPase subunit type 1 TsaE [Lishizhenia sp.]MDX1445668.1 tRNA (adenosine(37)-N6)-threonylcarbamoyltransferase complex ATPase subunit type 1 TsaE [Lishizhenia sp.]
MQIIVNNEEELDKVVDQVLPLLEQHKIFAFDAKMGSGKTTFIARLIGAISEGADVSSPTFGYVKEHETNLGTVHHFDLYRLEHEEEAYDIGIEEYLYGDEICLIEWPKKIENLLPENTVWVNIEVAPDQARIFDIAL